MMSHAPSTAESSSSEGRQESMHQQRDSDNDELPQKRVRINIDENSHRREQTPATDNNINGGADNDRPRKVRTGSAKLGHQIRLKNLQEEQQLMVKKIVAGENVSGRGMAGCGKTLGGLAAAVHFLKNADGLFKTLPDSDTDDDEESDHFNEDMLVGFVTKDESALLGAEAMLHRCAPQKYRKRIVFASFDDMEKARQRLLFNDVGGQGGGGAAASQAKPEPVKASAVGPCKNLASWFRQASDLSRNQSQVEADDDQGAGVHEQDVTAAPNSHRFGLIVLDHAEGIAQHGGSTCANTLLSLFDEICSFSGTSSMSTQGTMCADSSAQMLCLGDPYHLVAVDPLTTNVEDCVLHPEEVFLRRVKATTGRRQDTNDNDDVGPGIPPPDGFTSMPDDGGYSHSQTANFSQLAHLSRTESNRFLSNTASTLSDGRRVFVNSHFYTVHFRGSLRISKPVKIMMRALLDPMQQVFQHGHSALHNNRERLALWENENFLGDADSVSAMLDMRKTIVEKAMEFETANVSRDVRLSHLVDTSVFAPGDDREDEEQESVPAGTGVANLRDEFADVQVKQEEGIPQVKTEHRSEGEKVVAVDVDEEGSAGEVECIDVDAWSSLDDVSWEPKTEGSAEKAKRAREEAAAVTTLRNEKHAAMLENIRSMEEFGAFTLLKPCLETPTEYHKTKIHRWGEKTGVAVRNLSIAFGTSDEVQKLVLELSHVRLFNRYYDVLSRASKNIHVVEGYPFTLDVFRPRRFLNVPSESQPNSPLHSPRTPHPPPVNHIPAHLLSGGTSESGTMYTRESLNNDQRAALDQVVVNKGNVCVIAVAGSGKSRTALTTVVYWLQQQDPRQEKKKALFLCYNKRLQVELEDTASRTLTKEHMKHVHIRTLHSFARRHYNKSNTGRDDKMFTEAVNSKGKTYRGGHPEYGLVVLDEVQDFRSQYGDFVNIILTNMNKPQMYICGDPFQMLYKYNQATDEFLINPEQKLTRSLIADGGSFPIVKFPISYRINHEMADFVNRHLNPHALTKANPAWYAENCDKIREFWREGVAADPNRRTDPGSVVYIAYLGDASKGQQQPDVVSEGKEKIINCKTKTDIVDALREELKGFTTDNTAFVTTSGKHEKSPPRILMNNLMREDYNWEDQVSKFSESLETVPPGKMLMSTIHKFKGLEQECIVVLGLDSYLEQQARFRKDPGELYNSFYVAATRAKKKLIVIQYHDLPFITHTMRKGAVSEFAGTDKPSLPVTELFHQVPHCDVLNSGGPSVFMKELAANVPPKMLDRQDWIVKGARCEERIPHILGHAVELMAQIAIDGNDFVFPFPADEMRLHVDFKVPRTIAKSMAEFIHEMNVKAKTDVLRIQEILRLAIALSCISGMTFHLWNQLGDHKYFNKWNCVPKLPDIGKNTIRLLYQAFCCRNESDLAAAQNVPYKEQLEKLRMLRKAGRLQYELSEKKPLPHVEEFKPFGPGIQGSADFVLLPPRYEDHLSGTVVKATNRPPPDPSESSRNGTSGKENPTLVPAVINVDDLSNSVPVAIDSQHQSSPAALGDGSSAAIAPPQVENVVTEVDDDMFDQFMEFAGGLNRDNDVVPADEEGPPPQVNHEEPDDEAEMIIVELKVTQNLEVQHALQVMSYGSIFAERLMCYDEGLAPPLFVREPNKGLHSTECTSYQKAHLPNMSRLPGALRYTVTHDLCKKWKNAEQGRRRNNEQLVFLLEQVMEEHGNQIPPFYYNAAHPWFTATDRMWDAMVRNDAFLNPTKENSSYILKGFEDDAEHSPGGGGSGNSGEDAVVFPDGNSEEWVMIKVGGEKVKYLRPKRMKLFLCYPNHGCLWRVHQRISPQELLHRLVLRKCDNFTRISEAAQSESVNKSQAEADFVMLGARKREEFRLLQALKLRLAQLLLWWGDQFKA